MAETPGLIWKNNRDGTRRAYWQCRRDLREKGFRPNTVPIRFDPADPDHLTDIIARCQVLQSQMLAWADGDHGPIGVAQWNGTLQALVRKYETDPESPYRDLEPKTQLNYSGYMRRLMKSVGDLQVDAVTGADVRRWWKNMGGAGTAGLSIRILKAVLSYAATLGPDYAAAASLRQQIAAARFSTPGRRKVQFTYEHLVAFRKVAIEQGHPSIALAMTLQFSFAFRPGDVIGKTETGGRWHDGLTWGHIQHDGTIRKETNKTTAAAAHLIADYPDLAALIAEVPPERRIGPLIISEETGRPYTAPSYRALYRRLARLAGIPDEVWSSNARQGAITEAYDGGATMADAMGFATHTSARTNIGYNVDNIGHSRRVAELRVKRRG